ncbi:DNA/RNA non-specific endonuclease [Agromyces sp. NPDC004153]
MTDRDLPSGPDGTRAEERHLAVVAHGVDQARRYAALSGPFDPVEALRSIDGIAAVDPPQLAAIAAELSQACEPPTAASSGRWLMRGAERRRTLDALADSGQLEQAVTRRSTTPVDGPTKDLLDAIAGAGIFDAASVSTAIDAREDRETLERLMVGLGRAGAIAPEHERLPEVRAALTRLDLLASARALRRRGFFGREAELARISRWLDAAERGDRVRAMYIEGLPGVGKSTLLEEVAARLLDHPEWVVVRFDFDRAGLDVQDAAGLTLEFARQVSAQVPGAEAGIQQARQHAAAAEPNTRSLKGDRAELVPEDLGFALANALTRPPRRVFLVLDTLEVLRGRGETHPGRLFAWLDQLVAFSQVPFAVVGAGRGRALETVPDRIGDELPLTGLDDVSAERLLASLGVDPSAYDVIRTVAKGNPLALRLAAKIANEHGARAVENVALRGDMTLAYLYRFVLSRIDDPDLRKLANPGLVVRRINADVIREVIAPQVGLAKLSATRAEALFQGLAGQHWLVEPDPLATGFVRHRSDMRAVLLPLLYDSAPARSARIDRSAARWFDARSEPWSEIEAAYHRLQLMRRDPEVPLVDPLVLAQFDAITTAELPEAAQDVVHRSQGDRSRVFRGEHRVERGAALDVNAARELRSMNDRSDWLEGNYVYDRAFVDAVFDPKSSDADVALTFLWRSGRWSEARRLLDRQGGWHRTAAPLGEQFERARLDTLCRLEMGAEFDFDAASRVLRDEEALGVRVADLASEPSMAGLTGAALRFALQRAGISSETRTPRLDAVAAAADQWGSTEQSVVQGVPSDRGPAAAAGWSRITARTGPLDVGDADPPVVLARSLAVLSPFSDLVGTMSLLPGHEHLREYATAVQARLDELGNLPPHRSSPWRDYVDSTASHALQSLTDLGLFAELIGAAGYLRRDRDLNLVARSAERWRRSIAGAWSYGTTAAPRGWDRTVDVTMADRIAALEAAADASDRATAQLAAWHLTSPDVDVLDLFRKRSPDAIDTAAQAAEAGDAVAAAAVLLRRNIPSAFVPELAVLLATPRTRRGRPPGRSPRAPRVGPGMQSTQTRGTTMTDEERRFESIRTRLSRSPELRAAIQDAVAGGRIPSGVIPEPAAERVGGGDDLEAVVGLDALEAIVRRVGRPPLVVRNGAVELEPLPEFAADTGARIKGVEPSVKSVGRVEFVNHSMAWGGTGWIIGADDAASRIIATNRHVAKIVAARGADGSGVFLRSPTTGLRYGAEIDFEEEVGSNPGDAQPVEVTGILYLADDMAPDVALLRIIGDDLPSALQLAEAEAEAGQRVALIGYPAYDPRNDPDDQARYFKDLYEVKRFAPGFVMQGLGGRKALTHDCTSLGGNSGSPLISLEDGKVVGLHFAGLYGVENSAVGVGTLRRLAAGERPVFVPGASLMAPADAEAARDGSHDADYFADRAGYDASFLGQDLAAPWPGIPEALERSLAVPSDEVPAQPFELRYTHFGVKYHRARRQPLVTAVNLDGGNPVKIKRTGDKWFLDERIPIADQLTQRDYADPELDRGHMVRREDPNWDPAATAIDDVTELAKRANDDTFHYTNAALQHSRLNQGKQLWQGLENYILDSARTEGFKACVFTGPILRDDDPELVEGLAVPREFWKLVVMPAAGGEKLHATAYLLSQGDLIRELLEKRSRVEAVEGFVLGPYRTFQLAVADLAEATGFDLDAYVTADPLGASERGTEAVASGEPVFVPLESLEQVIA